MRKKWTEIGFAKYWDKALPKYIQIHGATELRGTTYDKDDQSHRQAIFRMAMGRFA